MTDIATIKTMITNAAASFTGRSWTSGPDALIAGVKRAMAADAAGHTFKVDLGAIGGLDLPNDAEHAESHRVWRSIQADVERGEITAETLAAAHDLAEEGAEYVSDRADCAASEGELAADELDAGDFDAAIARLEAACAYEREFGDCPAWGPVLAAVKALAEESEDEEIASIKTILTANHDFLVGENDLGKTAEEWAGLDIEGWLAADVFQACIARRFEAAGVTPAEVGDLEGWQVGDDECDRVGYAVANGDIRVEKAISAVKANREIIADDCDDDEAATLHARALDTTDETVTPLWLDIGKPEVHPHTSEGRSRLWAAWCGNQSVREALDNGIADDWQGYARHVLTEAARIDDLAVLDEDVDALADALRRYALEELADALRRYALEDCA